MGDLDKDNCGDVAIGAPLFGGNKGRAYVFSGRTGDTLFVIDNPTATTSQLGIVADGGDINADGYPDVLAADWLGTALAISGHDGSTLYTFTFWGSGGPTTRWIAAAGDCNQDGFDDVAVGGRGDSNFGSGRGRVDVFSGVNGQRMYSFYGEGIDDRFGHCVSAGGDVNADGKPDICVGAYFNDGNGSNAGRVYVYAIDMGVDPDSDGIISYCDNCPPTYNPGQEDCDNDGIGDACEYLSGDADNSGSISISDAVFLINYIFAGGPAPC